MADAFVRSYNPIWIFRDLTGAPLDDSYYAFFLQNTIPYLPQPVYQTPNGTPWSNPIELLANGALPENLYFDDGITYRLEIRNGPTQFDQLIYLVEDYVPNGGGSDPIDTLTVSSDNLITNPQFKDIYFTSPYTVTNVSTIDIAPGWKIVATGGAGTITVAQAEYSGDQDIPGIPPYGLQITSSGWTTISLQQTFVNNGALFTSAAVAASITAKNDFPLAFTASLIYSDATFKTVISNSFNQSYIQYSDAVEVEASTNTQLPNLASTIFAITWNAAAANVFITNIQLLTQSTPVPLDYAQIPIERQIDHTFNVTRQSLLREQKDSIAIGWQFGMNPWQFRTPTLTNVATNSYTADQTIIITELMVTNATGDAVAVGRASNAENNGFQIRGVSVQNRFMVLQYLDPATVKQYMGRKLSVLIRARQVTVANQTSIGMRLIWRTGLPAVLAQNEPILTWTGGGDNTAFTYTAGWTEVKPRNNPLWDMGQAAYQELRFESFQLPAATNDVMTVGIFLYSTVNMAAGDDFFIESISVVPNEFAIEANAKTRDEVLRQCQYAYQKTYNLAILPGAATAPDGAQIIQTYTADISGGNARAVLLPFSFEYYRKMITPIITFYSPETGASNRYRGIVVGTTSGVTQGDVVALTPTAGFTFAQTGITPEKVTYDVTPADLGVFVIFATAGSVGTPRYAYISTHFTIDARLGAN